MALEVTSENEGLQHQLSSNGAEPRTVTVGVKKRIQQFPKHDTVELNEKQFYSLKASDYAHYLRLWCPRLCFTIYQWFSIHS